MVSERWEFMQTFKKYLDTVWYHVVVDGSVFCDFGFLEDDDYDTIIETCICAVEGDEKFAGRKVVHTYLIPEINTIKFYTKIRDEGDWWLL